MSADHPLIGLDVRVIPGSSSGEWHNSFDGIVMDVLPGGLLLVMRSDNGSMKPWIAEYVRFADPERATQMLRAHATNTAPQDITTDGRTLSQVCTELVEAKQAAARLSSALQDLAIELDLPVGLPERTILEAIWAKVGAPEYTPPRWVPAKDVAVGTPYLAAVHQDGQTIADCDSGVPLTQDDRDAYVAMGLLILVGEWPPLPKETT